VRKILLVITLLLIWRLELSAQVQKVKINSVVVEGSHSADPSMIRLNSGLRAGSEVSGEDIQEAIKKLWAIRLFSDIQVYVVNQSFEGLDLLIKIKELPRLKETEITGYDVLSEDEVKDELNTYRGMRVSSNKISQMKNRLLEKYKEEGHLLAAVEIDTVYSGENRVDLKIRIEEGEEVQIEKITFHQNENIESDDLLDVMEETQEDRWWRSADFDREKFEADKELVVQYYKENGYRDAEILRDSVSFNEDNSGLNIDMWVYEGQKYHFGKISFEGNVIFPEEELFANLDIKRGDVYDQKKYDEGIRDRLQKMYYNQGYLFAQIQPNETPREDTLDIHFRVLEGHVVHIKEIIIKGNDKTNEKVIRREFKIHPGDVFNSAKLERSIRDVTVLNYFAYNNPDVKMIDGDEKNVNLVLDVEEKSTDMANMSAGYSQRDGLIGSLGLTFNNFSLAHPLSGGDGQRLVFDWQFGRIYRSISISFTEPWLMDTPTLGGFSVFDTRTGGGYYPWDRNDRGGTLRLGRRFYWPDSYFRGDWIFRYAQTSITNISDQELLSRYQYYGTKGRTEQISITQIISRDSRNSAEFPTFGSMNSLSTEFSGGILGGDQHFLKAMFISEWYMPLPFNFVLYSHNKFGLIETLKSNSQILYGEYFYIGGSGLGFAEGLRGYDDGQVGPITATGSPLGGTSMVKNSLELRFQIAPNPMIFGLLFAEAGNAWEKLSETNPFELRRSMGAGVRLFMPMIGIIGIDFGYGFDYYDVYGNRSGQWKVHFKFGRF
jgi:outer membrane protein insertion porin family